MTKFFIALALATFGFAFAWGELLDDLACRHTRKILAVISLVSMYAAFRYAPTQATEIVLRPGRSVQEWIAGVIQHSFQSPPPTTTGP